MPRDSGTSIVINLSCNEWIFFVWMSSFKFIDRENWNTNRRRNMCIEYIGWSIVMRCTLQLHKVIVSGCCVTDLGRGADLNGSSDKLLREYAPLMIIAIPKGKY